MSLNSEKLSEQIHRIMKQAQLPGLAVGVLQDNVPIFCEGFGWCDAAHKHEVKSDTLFPIASCTKSFTTTALALLAAEGLFDWDTPVKQYLPDFELSDPSITVQVTGRDIACHRTGIGDHPETWITNPATRSAFIRTVIPTLPFSTAFRQQHTYSNAMYSVLGELVYSITHQSWEDYVQQHILNKNHLDKTGHIDGQWWSKAGRADPFKVNNKGLPTLTDKFFTRNDHAIAPASELYSCTEDMLKWLALHLASYEPSSSNETVRLRVTHQPEIEINNSGNQSYALGWRVDQSEETTTNHHSGHCTGYTSLQAFNRDKKFGIALLTNLHDALWPLEQLVNELSKQL